MNLKETIANNAAVSEIATKAWKAGPKVAFVTGLVGSGVSLYLMWKAAKKHDETVAAVVEDIETVHKQDPRNEENESAIPLPDYRKELVKTYIRAGFKLGKLYAPAVVTELVSVGLMGLGYEKLEDRYLSTLAVATLTEHAFTKYRNNVIDILGEDADNEFRFGLRDKDFEVPDLDKNGEPKTDKNGEVKTKKVREKVLDEELDCYSTYARIFDANHTKQFDGGQEGMATSWYNREFLMKQQNYFNMLLKYRPNHTVFLNEVYVALGYEPTKAGQAAGWHYDPEYPTGDNEIIFVPIEFYDEKYEAKSVILDFNVDGVVWDFL